MKIVPDTHLNFGQIQLGHEVLDMSLFHVEEAQGLIDFAQEQWGQVKWKLYEEEVDEKVSNYITINNLTHI